MITEKITVAYAKDISNKIKSALLTRQKQGKFIGTKAPYEYYLLCVTIKLIIQQIMTNIAENSS